jgi:hypothetical protein
MCSKRVAAAILIALAIQAARAAGVMKPYPNNDPNNTVDLTTLEGVLGYWQAFIAENEVAEHGFALAAQVVAFRQLIQRLAEPIANGQCHIELNVSEARLLRHMINVAENTPNEAGHSDPARRSVGQAFYIVECDEIELFESRSRIFSHHRYAVFSWCGWYVGPPPCTRSRFERLFRHTDFDVMETALLRLTALAIVIIAAYKLARW